MTGPDMRDWCRQLLTTLATAPHIESTVRRELLGDALTPVDGGAQLAEEIEGLAYVVHMSHRQSGVDQAIEQAIDDAAGLLAQALTAPAIDVVRQVAA